MERKESLPGLRIDSLHKRMSSLDTTSESGVSLHSHSKAQIFGRLLGVDDLDEFKENCRLEVEKAAETPPVIQEKLLHSLMYFSDLQELTWKTKLLL